MSLNNKHKSTRSSNNSHRWKLITLNWIVCNIKSISIIITNRKIGANLSHKFTIITITKINIAKPLMIMWTLLIKTNWYRTSSINCKTTSITSINLHYNKWNIYISMNKYLSKRNIYPQSSITYLHLHSFSQISSQTSKTHSYLSANKYKNSINNKSHCLKKSSHNKKHSIKSSLNIKIASKNLKL